MQVLAPAIMRPLALFCSAHCLYPLHTAYTPSICALLRKPFPPRPACALTSWTVRMFCQLATDLWPSLQEDIDEVNKIAHGLKARLDSLARMNEAALKRPVWHSCVCSCALAALGNMNCIGCANACSVSDIASYRHGKVIADCMHHPQLYLPSRWVSQPLASPCGDRSC